MSKEDPNTTGSRGLGGNYTAPLPHLTGHSSDPLIVAR